MTDKLELLVCSRGLFCSLWERNGVRASERERGLNSYPQHCTVLSPFLAHHSPSSLEASLISPLLPHGLADSLADSAPFHYSGDKLEHSWDGLASCKAEREPGPLSYQFHCSETREGGRAEGDHVTLGGASLDVRARITELRQ